jgi:carnitine monooxygenase subunit
MLERTELPILEKPITDKAEASFTLSREFYTDPHVYDLEKKKIFYRTWQYVAHQSTLVNVGDYVTVKICDQNVFVIRSTDGELRAFYNVCKHRAHELLEGQGNVSSVIVCPYHAWTYEMDGNLRGAPKSSGRPGFDKGDYCLTSIKLEMFCDSVFVNLDPDAESLASIAGDLEADIRQRVPYLSELAVHEGGSFEGGTFGNPIQKAGWKVVVDNYVECYHCNHAHPAFADIICMPEYQVDTFKYWSRQLGDQIRSDNSAYKVSKEDPVQGSAFWFLWPNTTFNVLPGGKEFAILSIKPLSIDTSEFSGHSLTLPMAEKNAERTRYVTDVLAAEDISLCESVQRGLQSMGYTQGPIIADPEGSGTAEHGIHHFHSLVHQALSS